MTFGFLTAFGFSGGGSTTTGGSIILTVAARFGLGFVSTVSGCVSDSIPVSPTTALGFGTRFARALGLGGSGSPTSSVLVYSVGSFSAFSFSTIASATSP